MYDVVSQNKTFLLALSMASEHIFLVWIFSRPTQVRFWTIPETFYGKQILSYLIKHSYYTSQLLSNKNNRVFY